MVSLPDSISRCQMFDPHHGPGGCVKQDTLTPLCIGYNMIPEMALSWNY